jgi:hypothetical protein
MTIQFDKAYVMRAYIHKSSALSKDRYVPAQSCCHKNHAFYCHAHKLVLSQFVCSHFV